VSAAPVSRLQDEQARVAVGLSNRPAGAALDERIVQQVGAREFASRRLSCTSSTSVVTCTRGAAGPGVAFGTPPPHRGVGCGTARAQPVLGAR